MSLSLVSKHSIAAASSLYFSVVYAPTVKVQWHEWIRYLKKSINLGLCYAGFGIQGSMRKAILAGKAGFFSCAYDVVTDWQHFDQQAFWRFYSILLKEISDPIIHSLTRELYEKDRQGRLTDNGLERGSIALKCVLKLMDYDQKHFTNMEDIERIGRLLQIVDDVLDYEEDMANGHTNCLLSAKKVDYLKQVCSGLSNSETQKLFGSNELVVKIAIRQAVNKAKKLLDS